MTWSTPTDWLAELDLAADSTSLRMGTRRLGDRPWLWVDEASEDELALKAELTATRPDEVFAGDESTTDVGRLVAELVGCDLTGRHPLLDAGLSVQEDLCLLRRRDSGWHLVAASLHFPSRWRLGDKIGRHITEVHGPVAGYNTALAARVDTMFDRLTPDPVWRRNWFLHADDVLFCPYPPADRVVEPERVGDEIVVRSERQTLRRVGSDVLFTIRVQRAPLSHLLALRSPEFRAWIFGSTVDHRRRRGVTPEQTTALRDAMLADGAG
jgi:dimethylamine monooxygenase subunit A